MTNKLYYGDNLDVLREHIKDESVDLIYLDPPFNSNANYNILFKSPTGKSADSQIEAFKDTWRWTNSAESAYCDVLESGNTDLVELLRTLRRFLHDSDLMAYLAMMAARLIELHRVLKSSGSLYLHCDPVASHYLKLLLDGTFGARSFRSEISWRRSAAHNDTKQGRKSYGNVRDIILFYTKGKDWTWNPHYTPYSAEYSTTAYRQTDEGGRRYRRGDLTAARAGGDVSYPWPIKRPVGGEWQADLDGEVKSPLDGWEYKSVKPYKGRYWAYSKANMVSMENDGRIIYASTGTPEYKRYLDEMPGVSLQNDWSDISPALGKEDLGYPTQKPLALLERIIDASSNDDSVILDPFCGCGTAVDAAQKLKRNWIGIDVTHLSIGLIERRMRDRYGEDLPYEVIGTPNDRASAEKLASDEPYQFQYWITQAIGGQPFQGGRKGADRGIDGYIYFSRTQDAVRGDAKRTTEAAIISVKAGQRVGVAMVRDLKGVMEREKAHIGIFICVINPTRDMEREAASAGVYTDPGTMQSYPRLQIFTLAEYFRGQRPKVPLHDRQAAYKKAAREDGVSKQAKLL